MLEVEVATGESELFEQWLGEAVVVVAGDEDDAASSHRLAQLLEEGADGGEHRGEGEFAQLEHVAEQDQPVCAGDLGEQGPADRRVAAEVLAGGAAEVEVGDDRGAHTRGT